MFLIYERDIDHNRNCNSVRRYTCSIGIWDKTVASETERQGCAYALSRMVGAIQNQTGLYTNSPVNMSYNWYYRSLYLKDLNYPKVLKICL